MLFWKTEIKLKLKTWAVNWTETEQKTLLLNENITATAAAVQHRLRKTHSPDGGARMPKFSVKYEAAVSLTSIRSPQLTIPPHNLHSHPREQQQQRSFIRAERPGQAGIHKKNTHSLAHVGGLLSLINPAPLKLRPYGDIQIRLLLLLLLLLFFFIPQVV